MERHHSGFLQFREMISIGSLGEAITARDGARAERAMHDHLQDYRENILRRAFPAPALADAANV